MTVYIILAVSGAVIALLAYKIGVLKERLNHVEKQAEHNKTAAEVAARPHASADTIRERMRKGEM
ncbi:MAG: hypothetical protein ACI4PW_09345 [Alphaproteobacteria bacterium]|jgi:hypothetical protein|nr:MAG TPA: hypothetical protein [Caudoviricetes sp.]